MRRCCFAADGSSAEVNVLSRKRCRRWREAADRNLPLRLACRQPRPGWTCGIHQRGASGTFTEIQVPRSFCPNSGMTSTSRAGHEVRQGDIVLDCGANIGVFTRKAPSRGAALVVAIEPAPQTLNALRRNFDTEIRQGRVIAYPKGLWDHDAEME